MRAGTVRAMTTTTAPRAADASRGRKMLNKVPEVTLYFWVIKILATTVGETAADFLATNLHLGLTNTTYIMGAALATALDRGRQVTFVKSA